MGCLCKGEIPYNIQGTEIRTKVRRKLTNKSANNDSDDIVVDLYDDDNYFVTTNTSKTLISFPRNLLTEGEERKAISLMYQKKAIRSSYTSDYRDCDLSKCGNNII